jgi:hypothetical protein
MAAGVRTIITYIMTPIGLSLHDCRRALYRYRCLLLALAAAGSLADARTRPIAFEDLRHQLEVDVLARAQSGDYAVMSALEERVLAPTLRALQARLEAIAAGAKPEPALADLVALVDGALGRLPA